MATPRHARSISIVNDISNVTGPLEAARQRRRVTDEQKDESVHAEDMCQRGPPPPPPPLQPFLQETEMEGQSVPKLHQSMRLLDDVPQVLACLGHARQPVATGSMGSHFRHYSSPEDGGPCCPGLALDPPGHGPWMTGSLPPPEPLLGLVVWFPQWQLRFAASGIAPQARLGRGRLFFVIVLNNLEAPANQSADCCGIKGPASLHLPSVGIPGPVPALCPA